MNEKMCGRGIIMNEKDVRDGNNYELLMNEKKIPQKQYRTDVIYYVLKNENQKNTQKKYTGWE